MVIFCRGHLGIQVSENFQITLQVNMQNITMLGKKTNISHQKKLVTFFYLIILVLSVLKARAGLISEICIRFYLVYCTINFSSLVKRTKTFACLPTKQTRTLRIANIQITALHMLHTK